MKNIKIDKNTTAYKMARYLYRKIRFIYNLRLQRFRCISLSRNRLSKQGIGNVHDIKLFNHIIEDLVAYTGFPPEKLMPYILRYPQTHFESEFKWFNPKDELELTWFYRCSSAYLFANAVHPYVSSLDIITEGKVLDYGAGIGCNTIALAKRGISVDFVEISRIQADFIKFRAERHNLANIKEVSPYCEGRFDPLKSVVGDYDAIIAMDVLEHIPNYHIVVKHFIDRLKPGGMIIENSPFDPKAENIAIHIRASKPLEQAMHGMVRIDRGIWKKEG
jgi:2-polyprenyl-3-methyl-5-hydroxy-6-metoxy-1,4-benzoquinol methylase